MILSLLQLNINADNFLDKLILYLQAHDFDILQLQEIAGKDSFCGNIHCTHDCYVAFKKILDEKYNSELAIAQRFTSSPNSYLGNATFYKKDFDLIEKDILPLYQRTT